MIERISHFICWQNQDGNEIPNVSKTADDDLRENKLNARSTTVWYYDMVRTMANPSIHREQVYGEVQVLFLSSCPQNSLEK